jgi:hypothetical protein
VDSLNCPSGEIFPQNKNNYEDHPLYCRWKWYRPRPSKSDNCVHHFSISDPYFIYGSKIGSSQFYYSEKSVNLHSRSLIQMLAISLQKLKDLMKMMVLTQAKNKAVNLAG